MCPKVVRHLDVERNDLVELREVATAVRNVRVDEAIIRDAKKHACPTLRPTLGSRRRLVGVSSGGASTWGRGEVDRGRNRGLMTEVWRGGRGSVLFRGERLWLKFSRLFPLCSPDPVSKGDTDTNISNTDVCAVLMSTLQQWWSVHLGPKRSRQGP